MRETVQRSSTSRTADHDETPATSTAGKRSRAERLSAPVQRKPDRGHSAPQIDAPAPTGAHNQPWMSAALGLSGQAPATGVVQRKGELVPSGQPRDANGHDDQAQPGPNGAHADVELHLSGQHYEPLSRDPQARGQRVQVSYDESLMKSDVDGDGSCLYHSVARVLAERGVEGPDGPWNAATLRGAVADVIGDDSWRPQILNFIVLVAQDAPIAGVAPGLRARVQQAVRQSPALRHYVTTGQYQPSSVDSTNLELDELINAYVQAVRTNNEQWGGEIEVRALSLLPDVGSIAVYVPIRQGSLVVNYERTTYTPDMEHADEPEREQLATLSFAVGADYYEILGVPRNADIGAIRAAYRKLSLKTHPDKNRGQSEAAAGSAFKALSTAYGVLSDPRKRALYDAYGEQGLDPSFQPPQPDVPDVSGGSSEDHSELFQDFHADQPIEVPEPAQSSEPRVVRLKDLAMEMASDVKRELGIIELMENMGSVTAHFEKLENVASKARDARRRAERELTDVRKELTRVQTDRQSYSDTLNAYDPLKNARDLGSAWKRQGLRHDKWKLEGRYNALGRANFNRQTQLKSQQLQGRIGELEAVVEEMQEGLATIAGLERDMQRHVVRYGQFLERVLREREARQGQESESGQQSGQGKGHKADKQGKKAKQQGLTPFPMDAPVAQQIAWIRDSSKRWPELQIQLRADRSGAQSRLAVAETVIRLEEQYDYHDLNFEKLLSIYGHLRRPGAASELSASVSFGIGLPGDLAALNLSVGISGQVATGDDLKVRPSLTFKLSFGPEFDLKVWKASATVGVSVRMGETYNSLEHFVSHYITTLTVFGRGIKAYKLKKLAAMQRDPRVQNASSAVIGESIARGRISEEDHVQTGSEAFHRMQELQAERANKSKAFGAKVALQAGDAKNDLWGVGVEYSYQRFQTRREVDKDAYLRANQIDPLDVDYGRTMHRGADVLGQADTALERLRTEMAQQGSEAETLTDEARRYLDLLAEYDTLKSRDDLQPEERERRNELRRQKHEIERAHDCYSRSDYKSYIRGRILDIEGRIKRMHGDLEELELSREAAASHREELMRKYAALQQAKKKLEGALVPQGADLDEQAESVSDIMDQARREQQDRSGKPRATKALVKGGSTHEVAISAGAPAFGLGVTGKWTRIKGHSNPDNDGDYLNLAISANRGLLNITSVNPDLLSSEEAVQSVQSAAEQTLQDLEGLGAGIVDRDAGTLADSVLTILSNGLTALSGHNAQTVALGLWKLGLELQLNLIRTGNLVQYKPQYVRLSFKKEHTLEAKGIPLSHGVNMGVGVGTSKTRYVGEVIGANTLTYVQTAYLGIKKHENAQGEWDQWVSSNHGQMWKLFKNMGTPGSNAAKEAGGELAGFAEKTMLELEASREPSQKGKYDAGAFAAVRKKMEEAFDVEAKKRASLDRGDLARAGWRGADEGGQRAKISIDLSKSPPAVSNVLLGSDHYLARKIKGYDENPDMSEYRSAEDLQHAGATVKLKLAAGDRVIRVELGPSDDPVEKAKVIAAAFASYSDVPASMGDNALTRLAERARAKGSEEERRAHWRDNVQAAALQLLTEVSGLPLSHIERVAPEQV